MPEYRASSEYGFFTVQIIIRRRTCIRRELCELNKHIAQLGGKTGRLPIAHTLWSAPQMSAVCLARCGDNLVAISDEDYIVDFYTACACIANGHSTRVGATSVRSSDGSFGSAAYTLIDDCHL